MLPVTNLIFIHYSWVQFLCCWNSLGQKRIKALSFFMSPIVIFIYMFANKQTDCISIHYISEYNFAWGGWDHHFSKSENICDINNKLLCNKNERGKEQFPADIFLLFYHRAPGELPVVGICETSLCCVLFNYFTPILLYS